MAGGCRALPVRPHSWDCKYVVRGYPAVRLVCRSFSYPRPTAQCPIPELSLERTQRVVPCSEKTRLPFRLWSGTAPILLTRTAFPPEEHLRPYELRPANP